MLCYVVSFGVKHIRVSDLVVLIKLAFEKKMKLVKSVSMDLKIMNLEEDNNGKFDEWKEKVKYK